MVIDDSGDRKDGTATAHAGRQWLGRPGKTDNGIVTVTTVRGPTAACTSRCTHSRTLPLRGSHSNCPDLQRHLKIGGVWSVPLTTLGEALFFLDVGYRQMRHPTHRRMGSNADPAAGNIGQLPISARTYIAPQKTSHPRSGSLRNRQSLDQKR
ncbi:transposase [Streptomyces sp. S.PB5]|uniref:transposase n=1 Tax=Streptomyces sp. S.PB5 TaxID=3020844 RepID=UPI0025B178EF|nr:transposase [Streptomyces sp. S.PB5]MDN3026203.1 transposase [Streptomyces sp. S.PB5]